MADTAAEQLKRVLHLIPRLADGEEHPIDVVAAEAGRSRGELLVDLESLSERFDAPGGFVEGVSIFIESGMVCVNASHFHRPMRLTMPELCALELGLMLVRRERTPAERAPVDRALERLRRTISCVPSNDRHEGTRYADLSAAGSVEHLALIRSAVSGRHKLSLRYRAGGATESTTRVICPRSIVFSEQMWYLIATGEDDAMRIFRLDRIEAVERLDATFEPDAEIVARVTESNRAFVADTATRMRVRYSPRIARWVSEREGMPLDADGGLTMEHPVADDSWAVRHVLQYGPDAELVEPPELRALVIERLSALSALSALGGSAA